jgi:hypothetical protein
MKKNAAKSKAPRNLPAKTLSANMAAGVSGGKGCCKGTHIPEVVIEMRKAGGDSKQS